MNFNKTTALTALGIASVGVSVAENKLNDNKEPKAPNFVIINLDDAGLGDFSFLGALGYKTPNIDSMAANGMNMTNFYAVQPVSGASRCGLLTGCYPNRVGFAFAPGPNSRIGIHKDEMTMGELLKQKGYATAIYGKWHLGDAKKFLPLQHGFDDYYGLPHSNDMWPHHPTYKFADLPLIDGNEVLGYNTDQTKLTTDYTQHTIDFIKDNHKKPFFVYLAHSMPHVPLAVSDKFKGKSEQGLYGDVMMELDWSVGEVMKTLKEYNLDQNTVIILTSDNGPWANYGNHAGSSGGLREAKVTTFGGGVRVPCIVYWPEVVEAGSTFNGLVSNIDIFPTFAELSGAAMPTHKTDGISFTKVLSGANESDREYLCLYYQQNSLEAITDGKFKLVFPHKYVSYNENEPGVDGQPGQLSEREITKNELYDLRRDPGERVNVINQHPDVVERLSKVANEYRKELGDDLTNIEGNNRREVGLRDE